MSILILLVLLVCLSGILIILLAILEAEWRRENNVTADELHQLRLLEMIGRPISIHELRRRKNSVRRNE